MQERFSTLSYEEVIKMFADMTPLEETRSYKEIFAKGEAKGETKGKVKGRYETIREELERLRLLCSQNVLTQGLFEILSGPLKRELIYLEQLNSKDHKI
jgi:predicted transposase YdaD